MPDPYSDDTPSGTLRFVAYDLTTGRPVMSGTSAAHLLRFAGETPAFGLIPSLIEIIDYGDDGLKVGDRDLPLDAARMRFLTVFRGAGGPELPAVGLTTGFSSSNP